MTTGPGDGFQVTNRSNRGGRSVSYTQIGRYPTSSLTAWTRTRVAAKNIHATTSAAIKATAKPGSD